MPEINKCVALTLTGLLFFSTLLYAQVPVYQAQAIEEFTAEDARQGVAVDDSFFYAVNNYHFSKHDKHTGELIAQFDGDSTGPFPLIHLDSAMILNGMLYAAHSNYPQLPMLSSVEILDADTLTHVATHNLGAMPGSLTWIDWHEGYWWAGFGNYDKVQDGQNAPYGTSAATFIAKMDDQFNILQQWTFPTELIVRFAPMSNSGGSWGPDGYLYLTGHDHPEAYVVQLPEHGNRVQWKATVQMPGIEGQGIAWDRSQEAAILWGILKKDRKVLRFAMPAISK